MPSAISAVPSDGPLMRWIIEQGARHAINLADRQGFTDVIAEYRHARDNHRPYTDTAVPIKIGSLGGNIEFMRDAFAYYARITLYEMTLAEKRLREGLTPNGLILTTKAILPSSVRDQVIDTLVDEVVTLPETFQPVIAGRKIVRINQTLEWTAFTLDRDNWS